MAKATAELLKVIYALLARKVGRDLASVAPACPSCGALLFRNEEALRLAAVRALLAGRVGDAVRVLLTGRTDPSSSHYRPGDDGRIFVECLADNNRRGSVPVRDGELLFEPECYSLSLRNGEGRALQHEDDENRRNTTAELATLAEQRVWERWG